MSNYLMSYFFYLFVLVFVIYHEVHSYTLISLGNVTIPTTTESVQIDQLSYNKLVKDKSKNVTLSFQLKRNFSNADKEEVNLKINNHDQKGVGIITNNDTLLSNQKIYILKEQLNDTTLYTIKFSKFDYIIIGMYTMEIKIGSEIFLNSSYIFSVPIVNKFPKPKLGLEGDPMRFTCVYDAYPNVTEIRWERLSNNENPDKPGNISMENSTEIFQDDRINFISGKDTGKENDTLYITKLLKTDSGLYKCVVTSPRGKDFGIIKITVKDRWAALYPFIGIVIEVILLVTAILAYEKYQIRSQNKKNYGENVDDDNKDPDILLANRAGDDENLTTDNEVQQNDADIEKTNNVDSSKPHETATAKIV